MTPGFCNRTWHVLLPLLVLISITLRAVAQDVTSEGPERPLGRVLYSPEQRRALEARVQGGAQPDGQAALNRSATASGAFHYNGMAQREGGAPLVWVNGQLVSRPSAADGNARVSRDVLQRLRPGQSNGVPEFGADARIEVHRAAR